MISMKGRSNIEKSESFMESSTKQVDERSYPRNRKIFGQVISFV
jgi:hypothetical protein